MRAKVVTFREKTKEKIKKRKEQDVFRCFSAAFPLRKGASGHPFRIPFGQDNATLLAKSFYICQKCYTFAPLKHSDSSAVGSVLRSGRRGREFESPLSDNAARHFT